MSDETLLYQNGDLAGYLGHYPSGLEYLAVHFRGERLCTLVREGEGWRERACRKPRTIEAAARQAVLLVLAATKRRVLALEAMLAAMPKEPAP